MNPLDIVLTLGTSTFLIVLGFYLFLRSGRSPALLFIIILICTSAVGNALMPLLATASDIYSAELYAKFSSIAFCLMLLTLLFLVLVFPYNYALIASAKRTRIFLMLYAVCAVIASSIIFVLAEAIPYGDRFWMSGDTLMFFYILMLVVFVLSLSMDLIIYRTTEYTREVAKYFGGTILILLGAWLLSEFLGSGPDRWIVVNFGILAGIGLIAYLFVTNKVQTVRPVQEVLSVATKSMYKLLSGRIYVVEEEKPRFAFELFGEILKRRCFDCMNDESFACESLDCRLCSLPCPCRECKQHKSRTQGLVITRRHPVEVRIDHMIQTTPIIWLTSIPGRDNIDPSKLSLLTDIIVNFIEKSQNGVVIVDGIEYLITANDFGRVIRAVDRWSEVVMANYSKLIISVNPKAFDPKELALIERNREVVKLTDKASVEKILAGPGI
ncbi:MAG: DUF835 domain-containing protein [Thermoplasmata archaeon]